ncbi:two-component system response regulator [Paraburkholderia sp. BCC1886]|uniref:response regulator n=1 Tax=Paraburkholderia sp. BCC1886 TaxID=2562670 RepID=UPI00118235E1|nr:response regulator [Paraburkholderia sp. BCC1886]
MKAMSEVGSQPQIWRYPYFSEPVRQTVLIVHNELCIGSSMRELLAYRRIPATSTTFSDRALDLAAAMRPVLVIIDTTPPRENGPALAQSLRKAFGSDDVMLMALVNDENADQEAHLAAAGFDACWIKPMSIETLVQKFCFLF